MKSYQEMTPIERYEWLNARPVQFADHCVTPGKCPLCLAPIETHKSLSWEDCPELPSRWRRFLSRWLRL